MSNPIPATDEEIARWSECLMRDSYAAPFAQHLIARIESDRAIIAELRQRKEAAKNYHMAVIEELRAEVRWLENAILLADEMADIKAEARTIPRPQGGGK